MSYELLSFSDLHKFRISHQGFSTKPNDQGGKLKRLLNLTEIETIYLLALQIVTVGNGSFNTDVFIGSSLVTVGESKKSK